MRERSRREPERSRQNDGRYVMVALAATTTAHDVTSCKREKGDAQTSSEAQVSGLGRGVHP